MIAKVVTLVSLDLIGDVEAVDLFEVLTVTLSQRRQLFVRLPLLRLQTSVGVLGDLELVLDSLNVDVTIRDQSPLSVQLRVQLGVLPLAIVVDGALLIDLGP